MPKHILLFSLSFSIKSINSLEVLKNVKFIFPIISQLPALILEINSKGKFLPINAIDLSKHG